MPDENRPRVQVVCQQYSPQPTDVLCKKWIRNGKTVEFELPPFALPRSQLLKAFKSLDTLVDKYWEILVSELNVGQDELVSRTLREAIRHHKKVRDLDADHDVKKILKMSPPVRCYSFCSQDLCHYSSCVEKFQSYRRSNFRHCTS